MHLINAHAQGHMKNMIISGVGLKQFEIQRLEGSPIRDLCRLIGSTGNKRGE